MAILPHNGAYKEAEQKLAAFGIRVFVISGYDTGDFENQVTNIGRMSGAPRSRRTIDFETTLDYGTSFPGGYYFTIVQHSGARNIFDDPPANLKES